MNQIRHLGFTAPDDLREHLHGLSRRRLAGEVAALRPRPGADPVAFATKTALRSLGRRVLALDDEMAELDALVAELVARTAPALLSLFGVGAHTAALLLVTAGDNPDRFRSEAAWAHLCGVSPIQASSGKVTRYRLNRGGDRQANHALWRIAMTRMSSEPRTRDYVAATRRGPLQTGDHPDPQALHRPRGLPASPSRLDRSERRAWLANPADVHQGLS